MSAAAILAVIFCGIVAAIVVLALLRDVLITVYQEGYKRGREDAADWWTQAAIDVEAMKEISNEERPLC
jgi:hypothetical protein